MNSDRRRSLLRLIINAGLEEEFINWLKQRGYRDLYGRLDNVPLHVIDEFVHEYKLDYDENSDRELINEINNTDYYEEYGRKNRSRK